MEYILIKKHKRVLKILIKLWDNRGEKIALEDEDTLYKKYFSKKYTNKEFHYSLITLKKFDYINCRFADDILFFIRVTEIGESYFPTIQYEKRLMFLNGIIFPIIVAFITALVTSLITLLIIN